MVIYPHCFHPYSKLTIHAGENYYLIFVLSINKNLFVFFCSLNCFYVVFEHEINVKGGTNSLTYWF